MDTLQAFLTMAATVVEYFFFGYLVLALLFHAFQMQALESSQIERSRFRSMSLSQQSVTKASQARSSVPATVPNVQPSTLVAAS